MPDPQGPNSSLVVGRIVLEFPDGFFGQAPTTLEDNVQLSLMDTADNRRLEVFTKLHGYYYFPAEPGNTYVLQSWSAEVVRGNHRSSLAPSKIGWRFKVQPGKVNYLGDIILTFRAPNKSSQVGKSSEWDYDIGVDVKFEPAGVKEFVAEMDPSSPWLAFDVIPAKLMRSEAD
jgi:hypothetical protein